MAIPRSFIVIMMQSMDVDRQRQRRTPDVRAVRVTVQDGQRQLEQRQQRQHEQEPRQNGGVPSVGWGKESHAMALRGRASCERYLSYNDRIRAASQSRARLSVIRQGKAILDFSLECDFFSACLANRLLCSAVCISLRCVDFAPLCVAANRERVTNLLCKLEFRLAEQVGYSELLTPHVA